MNIHKVLVIKVFLITIISLNMYGHFLSDAHAETDIFKNVNKFTLFKLLGLSKDKYSTSVPREPTVLTYYDDASIKPKFLKCKEMRFLPYHRKHSGGNPVYVITMASCKNGPFGKRQLKTSMKYAIHTMEKGLVYAQASKKQLSIFYRRHNFTLSKNKKGFIFLTPIVGHGIFFVPTAVIHSKNSNQSIVVQIFFNSNDEVAMEVITNNKWVALTERIAREIDSRINEK